MTAEPARWTVDKVAISMTRYRFAPTVWWTFGQDEALEPWEALDPSEDNPQFEAAYDALIALADAARLSPEAQAVIDALDAYHDRTGNWRLFIDAVDAYLAALNSEADQ